MMFRHSGLSDAVNFSSYHQVLNRARWSALELSGRLLQLLRRAFVTAGGHLTFVIDEHLERRWGRCIKLRGHYRDPLASSKTRSVSTSGVRWIVLALVVTPSWSRRSTRWPMDELHRCRSCRHWKPFFTGEHWGVRSLADAPQQFDAPIECRDVEPQL